MRTVRRTTSRSTSRPSTRRAYARLAAKPRKTPAKKRAKAKKATAPIFVTKVKALMSNLNTFAKTRAERFGKSDPIAKSLKKIHSTLSNELEKYNIVNPNFVRALKKINPSLKGKGPKSLRSAIPSIAKTIRENVRSGVKKLLNNMNSILQPMNRELQKLENKLNKEIKAAGSKKMQLKVNPALKRRINILNNKIARFKTNWNKRLTPLATHGSRDIKSAVNKTKNQLDEVQKNCRKNLSILNRYAKTQKRNSKQKVKALFTANQANAFESQWKKIQEKCDKTRADATRFFEQLKSIKLF